MGCGCGKGRVATSAMKDRVRSSGGQVGTLNQYISGNTTAPVNTGYNKRMNEYRQTLHEYVRGRGR